MTIFIITVEVLFIFRIGSSACNSKFKIYQRNAVKSPPPQPLSFSRPGPSSPQEQPQLICFLCIFSETVE